MTPLQLPLQPIALRDTRSARTLFSLLLLFVSMLFTPNAFSQQGSSIVIHDNTGKANGGENATTSLRSELESALNQAKPCVDIMDDEDIRNVLESERDKNLVEGGDPQEVLTQIGNLMQASYVMGVSATPGPGGSSVYTVVVMNPKNGSTIARQTGTDAKQIAQSIVGQLGSNLPDNCQPHWTGMVKYVFSWNETKTTNDEGAMRAGTRNTKRTKTETYSATNTIIATLLPPQPGSAVSAGTTMARVGMRSSIVFTKNQETNGEMYCRPRGGNPYWKGYSLTYSETTTQLGAGAANLPVSIAVDKDGVYRISVSTPQGTLLGKVETSRSETTCEEEQPTPKKEAIGMPEQTMPGSSFQASGKTDPQNPDTLSGSQTLPDGKTKISWNLRLVKPKKKN